MAIEKQRRTTTVVTTERTRAVEINCDITIPSPQWTVAWFRQEASVDEAGKPVGKAVSTSRVDRQFAQIMDDFVILADGTKMNVAQIAEAISMFGDKYQQEDVAKAAQSEVVG